MKRNYLVPAFTSVLSVGMLATGILAYASTPWKEVLEGNEDARPSSFKRASTPPAQYLKTRKAGNPENSVMPARDGMQTIPTALSRRNVKPASIMRSVEAPRGHVYGVVNRDTELEYNYQAYIGEFDLASGRLTPLHYGPQYSPYTGYDYVFQANSYRKGDIICMTHEMIVTEDGERSVAIWRTYDLLSGELTGVHQFSNPNATGYTVTYDPDLDIFYVVGIDNMNAQSEGDGFFGIVKPNDNGEWTYHMGGKLETKDGSKPFIAAAAYNPVDKQLYAFDNDNNVFTVEWGKNINMPETTLVSLGFITMEDDGILFECNSADPMAGQITYSPTDEQFVAIYRDNANQKVRIAFVHPETFEGVIGADVRAKATPYVTAIFCTDDFASSDAPMLAPEPVVNFDKASLSGSFSFTAPTESYIGVDLSGSTLKATVSIDGKVIDTRDIKAGQSFTLQQTLTQGAHVLQFSTALGEDVSPLNTVNFYVGYDAPEPVKNIKLTGTKLSWDAPGAVGFHGGYVDQADITYNVYLAGVKQNSEPLTAPEFQLTVPEEMKLYDIAVEAISQGQASPKTNVNKIFGKAFDLPFRQLPTQAERQNYGVIDANNDGWAWKYYSRTVNDRTDYGMGFETGYTKDADDWLILPLMHFPDPEKLYNLEYDMSGVYEDLERTESFEVWLGTDPSPEGMKTMIYSTPNHVCTSVVIRHLNFPFAVPEAGDYYLAIHATSTRSQESAGFFVNNFAVTELNTTSAVPGEPTDVEITAAPYGLQEVALNATLPTVDILGKPLPADKPISLTLSYTDGSGGDHSVTESGLPGQRILVENTTDTDGFQVYAVTPSNENGAGYTRTYRLYVGMDVPLCPTEIKGVPTDDNLGIQMTWKAPGSVGYNGGYVDLNDPNFTYRFYTRSGINLQKIADVKDTFYTYYPYGEGNSGKLDTFYVGPSALNMAGESRESLFVMEDLGVPYELPMLEEWNSTKFTYGPYTFFTSDIYKPSYWENTSSLANLPVGAATLVQGGIIGYSQAGYGKGKMILPKFNTIGIKKTLFKLRYWDYADAPKYIKVIGRRAGNDQETVIGTFELRNPARGVWVDGEMSLPTEFSNCGWVQLRLETEFTGAAKEYLVFDSFQVMDDADYDLKLVTLDGINKATIGDDLAYDVVVANSGRERMQGNLKVEIVAPDGKVLDAQHVEVPLLNSNQTFEKTFNFHISFTEPKVVVRASLDVDDENLANNTKEIELSIMPSSIPVVNDLKAEKDDATNTVKLSWSAPTSQYGNFENFEGYQPFGVEENFDYWKNVNGDDLWPIAFTSESTGEIAFWENSHLKKGWQIYDYDKLGFNNDRLKPHSGKQALLAVCGGYDEEGTPIQTSKWLLSPLCEAGTQISFWYTTFDSATTEYVEIWTCDKPNGTFNPYDNNIRAGRAGDYRKVASKSKVGSEDWENIKFQLGRKEVKFALRYCSYDGYAAAIDDISFTPAEMLTRTPESYNIYRCDMQGKNPVLVAENVTGTNYTDTTWDGTECQYYVVANNTIDEKLVNGPASNYAYVAVSGVGEISDSQNVTAGKGEIFVNGFEGQIVVIAAADGKVIVNSAAKTNNAVYAVENGVYLVTIGKQTFKVIVK